MTAGSLSPLVAIGLAVTVAVVPPVLWQTTTRRFRRFPTGGPGYTVGLFAVLVAVTAAAFALAPVPPTVRVGQPTLADVGLMLATSPVLWLAGVAVGILGALLGVEVGSASVDGDGSLPGSALVVATVGPTEEFAFRGFVQPVLVGALGTVPGLAGMGLLFGLYHYPNSADSLRSVDGAAAGEMAVSGLGGVVLGVLYLVSGNLLVPVVGHSLHVGSLFVYGHLSG